MDMHFPSDLLVFVGYSHDYNFNRNTYGDSNAVPVIAAMSIVLPVFKWTLASVEWSSYIFSDIDMSDDGAKAVVAGSGY
jgi:hypothetical protein